MKKNKSNIICAVICIVVTLAIVGGAVVGVLSNSNNEGNYPNTEETTNDDKMQSPDETDGNKESENTSGDFTDIPTIRDDPKLPDVQGHPSIDVEEMTKNPEAEVVGSKVEYGTKESGTNAE